jgi:O-methyltransferase/8-demethyl-8-(2,3-dimethoxy-alpha-L-rhamnosyl)tetracenomycin-C 4'-O-methyltransferase
MILNELNAWMQNVAAAALTSMQTVRATYDLARNCIERDIAGDFVECGVFGGVQCAMMAKVVMLSRSPRKVHLFDCFGGVPRPGPNDPEIRVGHNYDTFKEQTTCSLEDVQRNMRQWGIDERVLVYHPGLFEDVLPALSPHFPIALLRLDGDLYESTKVCIRHLLPDVTIGGWIVVDDWGLSGARRAAEEMSANAAGPIYWQQQPTWVLQDGDRILTAEGVR